MIGKVLGNRYEIVEKIGGGGMSVVYKAKCRVLNRYVAIKILRNELTTDADFVEKFKQESLSAASLNHPNIVNIYDTGIEDDIYYIVMEYIKGVTLKDYITQKGNLSEDETINISLQVAEALKHAHANKIIHRDIKPHNIIITDEGVAKVADFGIAKAASSSTINNTSNVIGSVHYFSPEQARGGYVDEKSDIYSLGVVMYEMVTGVVPFDADNHISVAMKHIQDPVIPPSQKISYITVSKGLEAVILKCLEKHQSYRYQNVSELLKDLYLLQKNIAHDVKINNNYLNDIDSPTIIMPKINSKMLDDNDTNSANSDNSVNENNSINNINSVGFNDMNESIDIGESENSKAFEDFFASDEIGDEKKSTKIIISDNEKDISKNKQKKKKKKDLINSDTFKITFAAILSALAVASLIGFFVIRAILIVPEVEVPNLVGKTEEEARKIAKEVGLLFSVKDRAYNSEYEEGIIYSQNEDEGQKVKKDFPLEVLISKGAKEVEVPNLAGKYSIEAATTLKDLDLKEGDITSEFNDSVPSGKVIRQSPEAGKMVSMNTEVNFVLSKGPEVVNTTVPTLVGLSLESAKAKILEKNLTIGEIKYDYSDEYDKNLVIKQTHTPGSEIEEFTYVGIVVSLGKKEVTEPSDGNNDNNSGNNSGGNTEDVKYSQINVPLPKDKEKATVVVYKIIESGNEVVFEQEITIKDNEESILVTVSGVGTQYFEVFVDGESLGEIKVNFN